MKRYFVDVTIYGTAYVEAESEAEARKLIVGAVGSPDSPSALSLAARDIDIGDGVQLSPEFTAYGIVEGAEVEEAS